MIIIAGTINCDPEKMEEALEAIRPLMEGTHAEEGSIDYVPVSYTHLTLTTIYSV